jgi:hypothetical protein
MPWSIANWPANGNFLNNMALKLAPFNDLNNNSRYEPEQGEYPIILGDQAAYFIFNDDRDLHGQTNGNKLGIEIHAMAYAFENANSDLDNTIFINYRIYNRSENNYSNLKLGLWTDFRLGCPFNDMIGCDTLLNTYFCYNGSSVDACGINGYGNFPPAQGVTFLNAKMSSFNDAAFNIIVANNADRYYQLLSGNKSDGSPLLRPTDNDCTINPQSTPTKFLYSDDPNDTSLSAYSEINCSPLQGNKKALGAIDILSLPAKSNVCIDVAFPFAQDSNGTNLTSVTLLKQRVVSIQDFYNNNPNIAGCSALFLATSITENSLGKSFLKVFPNPAKSELFVFFEDMYLKEEMEISIYDVTGKIVLSEQVLANNLKIDIESLQSGMYFINASAKGFFQSNRFIKY